MEKIYTGKVIRQTDNKLFREYSVFEDGNVLKWELTQNQYALFDSDDFGKLIQHEWRAQKEHSRKHGVSQYYAITLLSGYTSISSHRFLAGLTDRCVTVDHKNMNGLDNRRGNLRLATTEQQALNKSRNGATNYGKFSSQYRGVVKRADNGRYRVRGSVLSKQYNLGHFSDPIKAAEAWDDFIFESFKDHDPLCGMSLNGIESEPTINFIHFNFPERLGLK